MIPRWAKQFGHLQSLIGEDVLLCLIVYENNLSTMKMSNQKSFFFCRPQNSCLRRMLHSILSLIRWVCFCFSYWLTGEWVMLIETSATDLFRKPAFSQPSASITECLQYWTGLVFVLHVLPFVMPKSMKFQFCNFYLWYMLSKFEMVQWNLLQNPTLK